jgi:hypothetical protein
MNAHRTLMRLRLWWHYDPRRIAYAKAIRESRVLRDKAADALDHKLHQMTAQRILGTSRFRCNPNPITISKFYVSIRN